METSVFLRKEVNERTVFIVSKTYRSGYEYMIMKNPK